MREKIADELDNWVKNEIPNIDWVLPTLLAADSILSLPSGVEIKEGDKWVDASIEKALSILRDHVKEVEYYTYVAGETLRVKKER